MVESKNTGKGSSLSKDNFNSLVLNIYIYVRSKVVLTKNYLQVCVSNSLMGIVRELFCNENKPASSLPKLIFVNFDTEYVANTFSQTII